jgi:hypothetical protein
MKEASTVFQEGSEEYQKEQNGLVKEVVSIAGTQAFYILDHRWFSEVVSKQRRTRLY